MDKTFDEDQALDRYGAVLEKYVEEYNRLPYAERYEDIMCYDFSSRTDCRLFSLDQEVQRNGFYLSSTAVFNSKNKPAYMLTLEQMPVEKHAAYPAWLAQL